MPLIKLTLRPGLNRDQTNYSNEGGWFACDKIRFRSGYPQKIGGWLAATTNLFVGICRQMFGWVTTFGDNFLSLGTNEKVYINNGTNYYDITPLRATTAAGDVTFAATNGSSTITVSDTSFGSSAGDYVTFSGAVSLGGNITAAVLNQNYKIATVINTNSYTITAKNPTTGAPVLANASDSGNGGVAVVGKYEIPIGPGVAAYGYGWGAGTWGRSGWGLGSTTPIVTPQRDWWFDNFDNDLVMNIRNGAIYYWERGVLADAATSLSTRAVLLSGLTIDGVAPSAVPDAAMQILTAQNNKHLLAFGCQPYGGAAGEFDPLLIRWANQDQPNYWTPSPTNSAGFIRLNRGSRILRAVNTRQEILVWTESGLNSLQFTGTSDVFALQELADNISLISPRAMATANNVTYWMGHDKFYAYSGRVDTLPCTLRNHVFSDINYEQVNQIIAGTNEGWNEIWWFYPSINSNSIDKYVIYNHLEKIWYYGNLARTAWLDNALREYPQAVGYDNLLYDHERGLDANNLPMAAYIQSSDFDIEDGEHFMLTRRLIPDISFAGSTANSPEVVFSIKPRNFPGSGYGVDPFDSKPVVETTIDNYTDQVFIRARARQMAIKVASEDLGVNWQLGAPRLDARADGKR